MTTASSASRVAFLARDLTWADESGGVLPFSYAARKLDASIRSAPDLGDVDSTVIDLRTDSADEFVDAIKEFRPTLIGASTYIWSMGLFCEVAKRVHEWDPSIQFVMGGPAARPSVLNLTPYAQAAPFIDGLVQGEAEEIVRNITRHHLKPNWQQDVPGVTVRSPLGWRTPIQAERPDLNGYASPYQLGTVPKGPVGFLETFRGCPIGCAFCQWGEERSDRYHSTEYLASHLRGMAACDVERVYVLDAGFNLSPRAFRNLVAAEAQEHVLANCQVLGHIYPTHIRDEHLDFFKRLRRAEITVGVQSFDSDVLKKLGRPFDAPKFEQVMRRIESFLDIDLELILGLPGDNPESFRKTLHRVMEFATTVRVFHCLALPDALLERAAEFDVKFNADTFMVESCAGWTQESLAAEWEYVRNVALSAYRPNLAPTWVDFRPKNPPAPQTRHSDRATLSPSTIEHLQSMATASGAWRLRAVRLEQGNVLMDWAFNGRQVQLQATLAKGGAPHFRRADEVAYSYQGKLASNESEMVGRLVSALHSGLRPIVLSLQKTH